MIYRFTIQLSVVIVTIFGIMPGLAAAQIQIGTIRGSVVDQNSAALVRANVIISNRLSGYKSTVQSDESGEFSFNNLPFATYSLTVESSGFARQVVFSEVRSNVPVPVIVKLALAGTTNFVDVGSKTELIDKSSSSSETRIDQGRIERTPNAIPGRGLQKIVAAASGATTQNNGLIHIRGVEDGIVYVVDGIPTVDRVDSISAGTFDENDIRSINVITGNFPAEFGGRSAAVVQIQPKSGFDRGTFGNLSTNLGNFRTRDVAGTFGGNVGRGFGIYVSGKSGRSDRYLDPVDERNFNNVGRNASLNTRIDWLVGSKEVLLFNAGASGSNFRVPNDLIQQINGQDQSQRLRDNNQSVNWEHILSERAVSNLAAFRREYNSDLFASQFDTPISASQDRRHVRSGLIGSLTQIHEKHTLKYGFEVSRVTPREYFSFFVTDEDLADEREVSEEAQEFTRADPFEFKASRIGSYAAGYVQDSFFLIRNLNVSAGLRFDFSSLPDSAHQFSPRIGANYFIEKTRTSFRVSFNRLYQPPQIENLLLGNSEQARRLSPFVDEVGGAAVKPERVSAFEVGLTQDVFNKARIDIAFWRRTFRNFGDPNTFFNTTLVFPNSVAGGFANGVDVRLNVPEYRGFSGFASYTNSRILQVGPINGGLFLTDEFIEIETGTRFVPDHDQRNTAAFGMSYDHKRSGFWMSLGGRYESGVPLEVDEDRLDELQDADGSDLVNFERGRVRPWAVFDFAAGAELLRKERVSLKLRFEVQNFTNKRFAYNFGSPFEGTHFGPPRRFSGGLRVEFR